MELAQLVFLDALHVLTPQVVQCAILATISILLPDNVLPVLVLALLVCLKEPITVQPAFLMPLLVPALVYAADL